MRSRSLSPEHDTHARTPERVLATVLFTDIVDSTGHAARLGDQRWSELLDRHDGLVRNEVGRYRGELVKTTGDGILATFDGPARAIECGAAIVRGVQALGIEVRAGLHSGECDRRTGDVGGMAVHIGARVAQLAEGGEVLVTGTVRDLVVGSDIEFEDRGTTALKGVPGQWRLYRVEATPSRAADSVGARRLRRPTHWRLSLAIGALAMVAAGTIAGVLLLSGGSGSQGVPATRPQPKPVATIKVGEGPTGISVGENRVWVASAGAQAVQAIDPPTDRLAGRPIRVEGRPISVAVGFGSVWVVDHTANSVMRLDPGERRAPIMLPVGDRPNDVATDKRWVWVTNGGSDTVSRVDPETNRVDETVRVSAAPRSVATGEGAVWVANVEGGSVSKINPQKAITVEGPIPVGQRPNDLAVGYGSVWVIDNLNGTLTRIDPEAGEIVGDPISVGSHPRGVKTGFGYVWVTNGADGTVTHIDPETGTPGGPPTRVGKNPADIAIGKRAVWTANFDASTVTKILP
jgi:YVTN family beta-propeller protein